MKESVARAWLALQCQMIPRVSRAFVGLAVDGDGQFRTHAWWPDAAQRQLLPDTRLGDLAQEALKEGRPLLRPASAAGQDGQHAAIACPVIHDNVVLGVVAVQLEDLEQAQCATVIQLLSWGSAWLSLLLQLDASGRDDVTAIAHRIALAALQHDSFQACATALCTSLAEELECERVALGTGHAGSIQLHAMSHSAVLDTRANWARALEQRMQAAIAADKAVCSGATQADREAGIAMTVAASVPLRSPAGSIGAICLVRPDGRPFGEDALAVCTAAASLLGPVLALRQHKERSWFGRTTDHFRAGLEWCFGNTHPWRRASLAAATLLLGVACLFSGQHRVPGNAVVEGSIQRTIAAPVAGYIGAVHARAGDEVSAGQLLLEIDTAHLDLDRRRLVGERHELSQQYRRAIARMERSQARILEAQIGRAEAQLALLDEQLSNARLLAPFDGLLVAGDLNRSVGAPVERGQVLFELAPLDSFRVALQIDEADIAAVKSGQRGRLVLTAMPGVPLEFVVENIVEVAAVANSRNAFRVVATLDSTDPRLRPGMHGVGKVEVDRRRLIWLWTHRLTERVRLFVWTHAF